MFPYFGRKARSAALYPAPKYPLVIEPFAGSMAYTLHHRPGAAIGLELDSRVVDLWNLGVKMGLAGKVPLPPELGSKTDELLVKLASYSEHALTSGTMTVTSRMLRDWGPMTRKMAESGRWAADHVIYRHGSYLDSPNYEATWFIDPPYQHANRRGYMHGADDIDYRELARWVQTRRGQVIVCEQEGADWLPFTPLYELASHHGAKSTEMVWLSRAF